MVMSGYISSVHIELLTKDNYVWYVEDAHESAVVENNACRYVNEIIAKPTSGTEAI